MVTQTEKRTITRMELARTLGLVDYLKTSLEIINKVYGERSQISETMTDSVNKVQETINDLVYNSELI